MDLYVFVLFMEEQRMRRREWFLELRFGRGGKIHGQ